MLNCFVWNFFKSLTNSDLPGASGLDHRPLPRQPAWPAAWPPPPAPAAPLSAPPSRSPSSRRTRSRRCRSNGSCTGGVKRVISKFRHRSFSCNSILRSSSSDLEEFYPDLYIRIRAGTNYRQQKKMWWNFMFSTVMLSLDGWRNGHNSRRPRKKYGIPPFFINKLSFASTEYFPSFLSS